MFGSTMLEAIMGMVFVFLAVSLAVTAANELLASLFRWRAKALEHGIQRLMEQEAGGATSLSKGFKDHALIQSLLKQGDRFPSYISARTFAMVLLDLAKVGPGTATEMRADIERNSSLPKHLKDVLRVLVQQVDHDVRGGMSDLAKLQEGVERWFDGAMDRVGGWYKRRAQYVSLAGAIVISVSMNIDCIEIVQTLSRDTTLRQSIAAQATQLAQKSPPSAPSAPASAGPVAPSDAVAETVKSYETLAGAVARIDGLGLPIGWPRQFATIHSLQDGDARWWWFGKVLGLLLTALAASLGAPFWFDVLSKFVSIRSSGKVPQDAPRSRAVDDMLDELLGSAAGAREADAESDR